MYYLYYIILCKRFPRLVRHKNSGHSLENIDVTVSCLPGKTLCIKIISIFMRSENCVQMCRYILC